MSILGAPSFGGWKVNVVVSRNGLRSVGAPSGCVGVRDDFSAVPGTRGNSATGALSTSMCNTGTVGSWDQLPPPTLRKSLVHMVHVVLFVPRGITAITSARVPGGSRISPELY